MNAREMLQKLGESLGSTASVRSVFGEPVEAGGKVVIPIARIAYGFGAGYGRGKHPGAQEIEGEGGGGGGGVAATPAGVLEITEARTRFIPFTSTRRLAAAFAAGTVLGLMIARRRLS